MSDRLESLQRFARLQRRRAEDPKVHADIDRSLRQVIGECERVGIDWESVVADFEAELEP